MYYGETISRKELIFMLNLHNIPLQKAYYITGFADGEGSFNTSFRPRDDYLIGWKVTPVFNISQKERDILAIIKSQLKCGTLRPRNDGVWVYEVETRNAILHNIIPFFDRFPFLSTKKKKDFYRFKKIVFLMERHKSTTFDDITEILDILNQAESLSCRKFTSAEIIKRAMKFWVENQDRILAFNEKYKN